MLSRLLAPVSLETFVERHWEREPLHVPRALPGYFADIYDVADVEESLVSGAREIDRFALVRAGSAQAALDTYVITSPPIRGRSSGRPPVQHVDQRKVINLFAAGYTLVINDAALLCARLQRACNQLQNDLGAYVGANVYFTPPGTQGFELHHDAHDTLTVQIEGTKTWRVYEPAVALPLESQPLHGDVHRAALTLHREITVGPGDTLYLPRGYAHEAVASGERTLHVTFALAPTRVIDLLRATLDVAATANVVFRHALPFGWQNDSEFAAAFANGIAPHLAAAFAPPTVATAMDVAVNDIFAASRGEASGGFDQLAAVAELAPDSMLRMNPNMPTLLRERATTVEVVLPGRSLGLPKVCMPVLEALQAGPVRFGDITVALSDDDRRFFIKTLVLEGVLLLDAKKP